jgi:hypothetical protein
MAMHRRTRIGIALALWCIPLALLTQGYWPSLTIPAVMVTYWALSAPRGGE